MEGLPYGIRVRILDLLKHFIFIPARVKSRSRLEPLRPPADMALDMADMVDQAFSSIRQRAARQAGDLETMLKLGQNQCTGAANHPAAMLMNHQVAALKPGPPPPSAAVC